MLKKVRCLSSQGRSGTKRKTKVVNELRQEYPLEILLRACSLSKSTYYYNAQLTDKDEKNVFIVGEIQAIYDEHKGRYGYRRIAQELKNRGYTVNHKKVKRLMSKYNLYSIQRKKRKYSSYKGTIGRIADDFIKRDFSSTSPNQKWFTDVTEFNLRGEKLYASAIIDGFNQEIIACVTSVSPNLKQINDMLDKVFNEKPNVKGLIFHSDQGWQYQHQSYQKALRDKGITQSMSRKGNSMDNGLIENFFGILKCEMFYQQEGNYQSLDELSIAVDEYIDYYNNHRIKCKLKGLTPVQFRNQSSLIAL